jgi:dipeptidyl-peptidase 4
MKCLTARKTAPGHITMAIPHLPLKSDGQPGKNRRNVKRNGNKAKKLTHTNAKMRRLFPEKRFENQQSPAMLQKEAAVQGPLPYDRPTEMALVVNGKQWRNREKQRHCEHHPAPKQLLPSPLQIAFLPFRIRRDQRAPSAPSARTEFEQSGCGAGPCDVQCPGFPRRYSLSYSLARHSSVCPLRVPEKLPSARHSSPYFLRAGWKVLVAALLSSIAGVAAPVRSLAQSQTVAAGQLTVERIYGSPPLSGQLTQGIEWAPDGKRLSYFAESADGKGQELWTMEAATGARKVLLDAATLRSVTQPEKEKAVQATGLGRVSEQSYLWAPDGRSLLFRGSDSLAVLDLATLKRKQLVSGDQEIEDPKFSPDSNWVSFVRDHNLWLVSVEGGQTRRLTTGGSVQLLEGELDWVYPEELDCRTAYWWSPDSTKIAYYEMNDMSSAIGAIEYTDYPQAGQANPIVRVGVVSIAAPGIPQGPEGALPETRWMDTGSDTDVYLPRVDWLPDSRRIAVQRLNRAQNRLDLLSCDAATGASKRILTQRDKYWINISDDLYFFSDGKRFLWSSEQTGFRHYYLYDMAGKQLERLTRGDWCITGPGGFGPGAASHPSVDEVHGYVYFMSNKANVTESQLYRVSLGDRGITEVTHGAGTHDVLIAPETFDFVDTFSTAMTPPRQDLYSADGTRIAAINENKVTELADSHLSPVEFLSLSAQDGTKLYAMMIKPPDFTPSKKYPALISVYGGPEAQNVRNAWGGMNFLWHQMMAEKGYIIFTLDNRGSYNRGHAFETPIYHQFGKVELEDQLTGVDYLKSLPYVDPSRIGIWGWSYGGYMTLYSMTHAQGVFKAGVSVAPVSDWRLYDTIYTERYMGTPQENPDGYRDSSPVNAAASLSGKLMMVHGTGDDNVHFTNTAEFINDLIDANRYPARLMVFPGRGHPISDHAARVQLFERITQFFVDNLQGK